MGQDLVKARQYGILAGKNDPNAWKPTVSNTLYGIFQLYALRKALTERPSSDTIIDIAGGATSIYVDYK